MCEGTPKVHYGTIKPGITWYYWNIHIIYTYSTSDESCRQINSEKVWFLTCSSSGRILLSEWWDDRWRRHLSKLSLGTREGVKKNCHFIFIQFLAFKYSRRLRNRVGGTIDFSCFFFHPFSALLRNDSEWQISPVWPDGDLLVSTAGSAVLLLMTPVTVSGAIDWENPSCTARQCTGVQIQTVQTVQKAALPGLGPVVC